VTAQPDDPAPPIRRPGRIVECRHWRERSSPTTALLACERVWLIAAVHGDAGRLETTLARVHDRLEPADGLVFGGNLIGRGDGGRRAVDLALAMRRIRMAERPGRAPDVAFLRGAQEEMLRKVLQIQFAQTPERVLSWMLDQGLAASLRAYGINVELARAAAEEGALALARWSNTARDRIRAAPGHEHYFSALRGAVTADRRLFIHTGLDPDAPLDAQGDTPWWGGLPDLVEPYGDFDLVARAYARDHPGLRVGAFAATVDDGCGFGGSLMAACFGPDGRVVDLQEG